MKKEMKRKRGRPPQFGKGRIRTAVRFSPERYAELKKLADASGRSVSEQVEMMIEERAVVLGALGTDMAKLRVGMFRREHRPVHTPYGNVWVPIAHPQCPPESSFIDPTSLLEEVKEAS